MAKYNYTNPVKGPITSHYGNRNLRGVIQFHNGTDIGIPEGTPVVSPADGEVIAAGYDKLNGNYIRIQHETLITAYAHLYSKSVGVGSKVKQGDTIALSGNTGASTGAHLHFGIMEQNQNTLIWEWKDPEKYFDFK